MLARRQRLRSSKDFTTVLRRGSGSARGAAQAIVVHAWIPPNPVLSTMTSPRPLTPSRSPASALASHPATGALAPARAGLVVGRVVGGAVERNRLKRRLRHLLRVRLGGLPAGSDIVVRALPGAVTLRSEELEHDLDAALRVALRRASRMERLG